VATTEMMLALAAEAAGAGFSLTGATAVRAPPVITTPAALTAAAAEVIELGLANHALQDGIIVAAFGDPGLAMLCRRCPIPVVGIAEAAILEAGEDGRGFGIATTTPALARPIAARVKRLGLAGQFTGLRVTAGDPAALMADPDRLLAALADVVARCFACDPASRCRS
jgi:allantoin racemase